MRKYIVKGILLLFVAIVLYLIWLNVFMSNPYKVIDIDITNQQEVAHIQKTFDDFKLPVGAKIEKATKVVQNGSRIFVKVLVPVDKIQEFNSMYISNHHEQVSELKYEIFENERKRIP